MERNGREQVFLKFLMDFGRKQCFLLLGAVGSPPDKVGNLCGVVDTGYEFFGLEFKTQSSS
jgi:hypothetical protein